MVRVLFVCVHNTGRSQMAEAFFNKQAAARGIEAHAWSVGTQVGRQINEVVVAAMDEVGISLAGKKPRQIMQWDVDFADRVITMHCGVDPEHCPANLGVKAEDWDLDDPAGQPIEKVRAIRDRVEQKVGALLDELKAKA
jgi:arsenate reductase (thioredoxin)